jgi:tRNA pseudouridine55 synthase
MIEAGLPRDSKKGAEALSSWDGALLVHKPAGITSFGVIEELQHALRRHWGLKRKDLPKLGHGGTLDPFATGLLVVCVGRGVKLARYFLGSTKTYEGILRFGETTVPGDPTEPISERSEHLPESLAAVQEVATRLTRQPYLQTPPMHSAKKREGRPLYELAREGIEVEREAKECQLYAFELSPLAPASAQDSVCRTLRYRVVCSSGTYIRTLAQDLARLLGTVGMLDTLHRSASGSLEVTHALSLSELLERTETGTLWPSLSAWIPFDRMLGGLAQVSATEEEVRALIQGRQNFLPALMTRVKPGGHLKPYPVSQENCVAVLRERTGELVAVVRNEAGLWNLERVFLSEIPRE